MRMYNSIEYSDHHSKTWGSLWQYQRDEPALDANGTVTDIMIVFRLILKSKEQAKQVTMTQKMLV